MKKILFVLLIAIGAVSCDPAKRTPSDVDPSTTNNPTTVTGGTDTSTTVRPDTSTTRRDTLQHR